MNTAWPPIFRHTGITLAGRKHFIFTTFNRSLLRYRAVAEPRRKSFSLQAIPTLSDAITGPYFQAVGIGKPGATNIGRRSGAQRGALEDKLRPEVFLDAPCIFPSLGFIWPTADLPQSSPLADELIPA